MSSCPALVLKLSKIEYDGERAVSEMKLPYDDRGGVLGVDDIFDIGNPEDAIENQANAR